MAQGLSQWATARLHALDGEPVQTVLLYRRDRPWEIELRFVTDQNDGAGVTWPVGRELLGAGLDARSGIGDVRVAPAGPQHLCLELHNDDGVTAVYLRHTAVRGFLQATTRLVPYGAEHRFFDLDSMCDALRRAA